MPWDNYMRQQFAYTRSESKWTKARELSILTFLMLEPIIIDTERAGGIYTTKNLADRPSWNDNYPANLV